MEEDAGWGGAGGWVTRQSKPLKVLQKDSFAERRKKKKLCLR